VGGRSLRWCHVEIMKALNGQAKDIADNEVSKNSNIGSQTHRVLFATIVK